MNILSITVIALLCIVLFWQMKPAPRGELFDNSFSLPVSKGLQGFLALQIFVHHVYVFLNIRNVDAGRLRIFSTIGVWLIGFFFFCSGYGLITSLHTKQDYLKGFLVKRVLIVLVPFFLCNYAYMSVELLRGMQFSTPELIASFFGVLLMNSQMWFAVEIMLLYIVFFLLFTYVKKEKVCIMTIVALTAMITLIGMLNTRPFCLSNWFWGEWWFNTSFMFLFGMIMAHSEEKIIAFVKKRYPIVLLLCLVAAIGLSFPVNAMVEMGTYYCEYEGSFTILQIFMIKFVTLLCQFAMVFFADAVVLMAMMKIKCGNRITRSLGSVSLELYLIHNLYLIMFGYMGIGGIKNPAMLVYAAVICSLITAYIIHVLIRLLCSKFTCRFTCSVRNTASQTAPPA